MSKKSRLIGPFHKQHGKRAETLLNPASQQPDHIHWSLARKLCSKKSLLLTCQILVLLVNTLAAYEKYPFHDSNSNAIISEIKRFSSIFFCIYEI